MNDLIKGLTILKDYPGADVYSDVGTIIVKFIPRLDKENFDFEDIEDLYERNWEWDTGRWIYYV